MWVPLFGGRTNVAWKGVCGSERFVAKLYSGPARNPLFPNDPDAEARLLQALAGTGLAPRFRAQFETDAGMCNLYDHIPGETWLEGVTEVATLMRGLHALPCPDGLRGAPDGSAALVAQAQAILARCSEAEAVLALRPDGDIAPSGARNLLHSDIVPGNLIRNATGLHLIDWQCPAVGDPCEDIAVFLSPAMQLLYRGSALSEGDKAAFFVGYDAPEITERYHALAPFFHWRTAAYCLWQMQNGREEYAEGLSLERTALQRSVSSIPT